MALLDFRFPRTIVTGTPEPERTPAPRSPRGDGSHRTAAPRGSAAPSSLLALGSAAVVAVYSAGFYRTREAAARFAEEARPRRAAPAAEPVVPGELPRLKQVERPAPGKPDGRSTLPATTLGDSRQRATHNGASHDSAAHEHGSREHGSATVAPHEHQGHDSAAHDSATRHRADTAAHSVAAAPAPTPAPLAPPPVAVSPVVAAPVAAPASKAQPSPTDDEREAPLWRDGTYAGWGTSRHGDIEAEVTVRDGRIIDARITRCLTQYSCSWISHLPGQVIRRQSPEVDFVSGATQSTNAYYYAIVDALKRAK
jgi:uncharacterized protein with FMN-binding domain